jgi:hypothetical protein
VYLDASGRDEDKRLLNAQLERAAGMVEPKRDSRVDAAPPDRAARQWQGPPISVALRSRLLEIYSHPVVAGLRGSDSLTSIRAPQWLYD